MKKKIVLSVIAGIVLGIGVVYWWILGQYNATMYSYANEWIKEEFIENNKVSSAYYRNENYNPELEYDDENWVEKFFKDENAPRSRTFIIKNEKTFNEIFTENSMDVNFDKEMVVLHIEGDVYSRDCYLLSILNNNNKLTFNYMHEITMLSDASQPGPRCIVIKMKKMDVSSVEFIEVF